MISLSTATILVTRKAKQLVYTIAGYEARKSAACYGLHKDNLFPERKLKPTINIHSNKRRLRVPRR